MLGKWGRERNIILKALLSWPVGLIATLPDSLHKKQMFACQSAAINSNQGRTAFKKLPEPDRQCAQFKMVSRHVVCPLPRWAHLAVCSEFYFVHMEGPSPAGVTWQCGRLWVSPKLLLSLKVKARKAPCLAREISAAQTGEVLLVIKALETVSSCESMFGSRICSTVISRAQKRFLRSLKRKSDLIKRAGR